MTFFKELKRRNVIRVGAAYVVAAWLIIQVVETIFPAFGFGGGAFRKVVIALAIGFIPVLILAWVFELTPEGLKRDQDVDRSQSIAPQTGKKLDRMIMVVLSLALGYFAFDKFVLSESREATARQQGRSEALAESYGETSIAVLPFDNMSNDPDNEYFSDGITEEILNLLANIPQLRVVSRSSAFAFKGKEIHIPDLAVKLNVEHVLEGSVRKSGDQVRITAQLIEARSDTHLWSETYDRSLDNIFKVQDDIAAEVTAAMKLTLVDGPPTVLVTDSEAHEFYLQGAHFYNNRTAADYEKAIEYFKKALEKDPQYAPAWGLLGATYSIQAGKGFRPYDEGFALAREASDAALRIDPDSAVVLRAWIASVYERDFTLAASHYRRALELWPNHVSVLNNSAVFAIIIGHQNMGIELAKRANKADPASAIPNVNLAFWFRDLGELENADAAANTALELYPDVYGAPAALATISLLRGQAEQALKQADAIKLEMLESVVRSIAHHELGNIDESNRILEAFIEQSADRYAYYIAMVYAWRNEHNPAFQWLDRAIDEQQDLDALKTEILLKNLHTDPRWEETLKRVGLADSQLSSIEF